MSEETPKPIPLSPRLKAQPDVLWKAGEYKTVKDLAEHLGVTYSSLRSYLKEKDKGIDVKFHTPELFSLEERS